MSPLRIAGHGTPLSAWRRWPFLDTVPGLAPAALVGVFNRAVFVAPHPDDEVLGTGGLLRELARLGRHVLLLSVTDGEASHPGSPAWAPHKLALTRPLESTRALRRLGIEPGHAVRGRFPDSRVGAYEARLTEFIARRLSRKDIVFSTWRGDGHPDHEATGRACARAAGAIGAVLMEVPIWMWHWAEPGDARVPWDRARKVKLGPNTRALKQQAVAEHVSQIEPDPSTGRPAVLPPPVLARLLGPCEYLLS